jgi:hypothetical protein
MPNAIPVDMMHAYVIGALQFLVAYYDDLAMVHLDDSPLTGGFEGIRIRCSAICQLQQYRIANSVRLRGGMPPAATRGI